MISAGLPVVAVDAPTDAPDVLVVGVRGPDDVRPGLLSEPAVAALRAALERPLEVGAVRDLPRPGERPGRVVLLGLGAEDGRGDRSADARRAALRRGGAAVARLARDVPTLVVALPDGTDADDATAAVEGLRLGAYRFAGASHGATADLARVEVVGTAHTDAVERATVTSDATAWARDLTNTRASTKTPAWLAEQASRALVPLGVDVVVRDEAWLAAEGFGGVLAVGGGSDDPPRLIEAHWRPDGASDAAVLVVGKGITFDSGGYDIKPSASMLTMYTDMAGGAAALAALSAVARARLPLPVTVLVPAADNAVSGSAFRPGDVITHRGGRTTEVTNTDAEGRLVLADAMAYGVETVDPRVVVDIATLTGAMRQALGSKIGGVIGDDDALVDALVAAGSAAGERLWPLPLAAEEYATEIDSPVADAVNSAGGPPGAITAALFLHPFAGGRPWAHLDIAGAARAGADDGPVSRGATGFGTRLLIRWLEGLAGS